MQAETSDKWELGLHGTTKPWSVISGDTRNSKLQDRYKYNIIFYSA